MVMFRALIFAAVFAAFGLSAHAPALAAPSCPTASLKSAQALAERAAVHLRTVGPTKALPDFMDRGAGFMTGDLYVWVFDLNGVMVANGRYPQYVGSQIGGRDTLGNAIVDRALREKKGWVEYRWYSPCTGQMSPKVAYFVRVGKYVVGAGAYPKPGV